MEIQGITKYGTIYVQIWFDLAIYEYHVPIFALSFPYIVDVSLKMNETSSSIFSKDTKIKMHQRHL